MRKRPLVRFDRAALVGLQHVAIHRGAMDARCAGRAGRDDRLTIIGEDGADNLGIAIGVGEDNGPHGFGGGPNKASFVGHAMVILPYIME